MARASRVPVASAKFGPRVGAKVGARVGGLVSPTLVGAGVGAVQTQNHSACRSPTTTSSRSAPRTRTSALLCSRFSARYERPCEYQVSALKYRSMRHPTQ
jgi:hypothetical protein